MIYKLIVVCGVTHLVLPLTTDTRINSSPHPHESLWKKKTMLCQTAIDYYLTNVYIGFDMINRGFPGHLDLQIPGDIYGLTCPHLHMK